MYDETVVAARFWHPFSDMRHDAEIVLDRAAGCRVWDAGGREYIDATAGLWFCNVGHGRAELADAAAAQMRRLAAYHTYGALANRPVLDLADRLASLLPIPDAAIFFTQSGSDAVDTAAKLARRYWQAAGSPERRFIVAREHAYHGMNGFGTSLAGIPANRDGYGRLIEDVVVVPHDDASALAALLDARSPEIAAFIGEPMIGAGGVHPPRDGYWQEVERLCRAHDVLLVADEVVTGFGRVGTWFGAERVGCTPDIVAGAKGVTSGYVPLGFVACGPRIREPFWRGDAGLWRHGYTYSGHATACAVALANVDILEREGLIDRAAALEPAFAQIVGDLGEHPAVREVRSFGLAAAVELRTDVLDGDPTALERLVATIRDEGVLTRAIVGNALQISPPLVIERDELVSVRDRIASALERVFGPGHVAATRSRDEAEAL
jgi:putrescine---pyruvate transaminase